MGKLNFLCVKNIMNRKVEWQTFYLFSWVGNYYRNRWRESCYRTFTFFECEIDLSFTEDSTT